MSYQNKIIVTDLIINIVCIFLLCLSSIIKWLKISSNFFYRDLFSAENIIKKKRLSSTKEKNPAHRFYAVIVSSSTSELKIISKLLLDQGYSITQITDVKELIAACHQNTLYDIAIISDKFNQLGINFLINYKIFLNSRKALFLGEWFKLRAPSKSLYIQFNFPASISALLKMLFAMKSSAM